MASQTQLPTVLRNLSVPVIASPMFTVSYPELVLAQCKAGIVGSFPALNARPAELLDDWLTQMTEELRDHANAHPEAIVGPIAVNQIVHASNVRLEQDVRVCVKHRVPIFISSLRAPVKEILDEVHGYGGIVLHDVINLRHAEKALEAGVDGLILVAAGAGGHAGRMSPFALVGEVRKRFDGPIALSGSIATGQAILAAQTMGADLAYVGTRFIASQEANASQLYKDSLLRASASDIIYTNVFSGVHGNYVRESIEAAGLDPDNLPVADKTIMSFADGRSKAKAWKDIWGAGQGVGQINDVPPVAEIVARLKAEYIDARTRIQAI
ncbi:nitronate monooxygenase family protein [Paraburkholderia fungorum]|uniref:Nitronate monooxygenase family protein n=1 Tax=Paraburkholderia fungorum TaxID=134537 RepID=A0AAU8ST29_9BURK|nr:nitronate monooxygenase family protein [Paraburkholderia fungorum]AJZ56730.1 nitronate monooxygenase family protein [Paraburkholderia fungorum]